MQLLAKNVRSEAKVFGLYNLSGSLGLLSLRNAGSDLVEGGTHIFLVISLVELIGSILSVRCG